MTPSTTVTITHREAIAALRRLTIDRESFDGGQWSVDDAETLEVIAASVREAIEHARQRRLDAIRGWLWPSMPKRG